ncbi:MAG: pyrroline-5-carboxylate reductase [Treponema sp.]|nr:pyrroline-5-carboxylate reductase [Treponema sp.]
MPNKVTVSFIGCGAMGGALVRAICKKYNPQLVVVSDAHGESAQALAKETGCRAVRTNVEAASLGKYVFLAVKPAAIANVVREISDALQDEAALISMAAGVTLEKLRALTSKPIVRIMPNTPAQVAEGMIALCCTSDVPEHDVYAITTLLGHAGVVERVDETLFNCVTAVSGSGPAYVFLFIEALADAAVRCGMTRVQAYTYAAQTVKGAAVMVQQSEKTPAQLKDSVCSPGGTTIEALAALEKGGLRSTVFDAVKAAYERAIALGT